MGICSLKEVLDARERRQSKRLKLLNKYGGLLINFQLNIPGNEKDKLLYKITMIDGHKRLLVLLKKNRILVQHERIEFFPTGPESIIMTHHDPKVLKRKMVEFEEIHPLGRLFDLDVFDHDGKQLSRSDLNLPERRCYVCDDSAKACARSKRHDINVVVDSINQMMTKFHTTESQRET